MHVWQSPPGTPATDCDEDSVQREVRSGAGATAADTDSVTRSSAGTAGATAAYTDGVTRSSAGAAGATAADTDGVTRNSAGTAGATAADTDGVTRNSAGTAGATAADTDGVTRNSAGTAGATAADTDGVTRNSAGTAGATAAVTDGVTRSGSKAAGATADVTDGVTDNYTDGSAGVSSVAASASSASSFIYEENSPPKRVCSSPPLVGSGRQSSRIPSAKSADDEDVERQSRSCCSKYSDTLKIFIPWRRSTRDPSYLPAHSVGLLSYISISWMSGLMYKTRRGIKLEDIWKLPKVDGAEENCDRLERLWFAEVCAAKAAGRPPSLARAAARSVATRTAVLVFISLLYTALVFFLLSHMVRITLDYINSPVSDAWQGWSIVALVVGLNLLKTLCINVLSVLSFFSAIRVVGGLQAMVFRKVLRLRTAGEDLSGQVANLINNDMERIMELMLSLIFSLGLPIMAVGTPVYSWYTVGPWSLIGYLPIILFIPVMKHITQRTGALRAQVCKVSDQRVSLMTEILNNVRLIKMYSWEESFAGSVENVRGQEVTQVRKIGILNSMSIMMFPVMSYVSLFAVMVAITLSGLPFTASMAFTVMSVLNCFQFSLAMVPFALRSIPEAAVAIGRIQDILLREEHVEHGCSAVPSALAVSIQHATFQWGGEEEGRPTNGNNNENSDNDKDSKNKHRNGNNNEKNGNDASNNNKYKKGNSDTIKNATNDTNKDKNERNKYNNRSNTGKDNEGYCFEEDIEDQFINGTSRVNMRNDKDGKSPGASFAAAPVPTLPSVPSQQQQFLRDIDFTVPKGKLLGICGSVGSGKSSLFSAICGDMTHVSGEVEVNGRVALVTQQAWIYNTSMRNNLLMGMPYDRERYQAMLEACCLNTDIQMMPNGDSTEIGEKGINLSGGQKQRVSLGRAVYSDRDIFLLDDPLSAVDTRVALHIFRHCITGCLRGKTILLVTHALHFLEQCDEVVLLRSGVVMERGRHKELLERGGAYAHFLSHDKTTQQRQEQVAPAPDASQTARQRRSSSVTSISNQYDDGRLISEENRETGQVSTSVYYDYMKNSGGWGAVVAMLVSLLIFSCARLFAVMWQQWWLDAGDGLMNERVLNQTLHGGDNSTASPSLSDADLRGDISRHPRLYVFQAVQAALFVAVLVTGVVKGYVTVYTLTKGSRRLHNLMYASVMRAPTSFFDVTPTGRIVTRFTKDVDEMDYRIPTFFDLLSSILFLTLAAAVLVCVFFPYFAVVLIPLGILFVLLGKMLAQGMREFKRLENVQKSPVVQSAVSCITGLQVIRAFGQEEAFTRSFYELVDKHTMVLLLFRLSHRWITFRMDLLSVVIVGAITTLCVITKGTFSTAIAGLAITSVNEMYLMLPLLMVLKTEFESRMTSVERVLEYAKNIVPEAAREVPGAVEADWPQRGALLLRDVCLRYRPNLPLVLKGITADIAAGEKIGVVGRTGAGKSSLVNALLRVVELERGSIQVDRVDVKGVGLHTLRSAVSVIPQDPVLFQGTIRYNLDPFGDHTDEAVLQAAARSRLMALVERHPEGLGAPVETSGQNFSVGERQLICLTRAVLRNSKILLLDEATASVDPETDQLIQTALHEAFHSATLLTVAHRLHTVAHYDRIMVLEKGQLVEFDTPHALLEKEGSLFGKMLAAIGVTSVDQLDKLS